MCKNLIEIFQWTLTVRHPVNEAKNEKNFSSEKVVAYFGEQTKQKKSSALLAMYIMIKKMLQFDETTKCGI